MDYVGIDVHLKYSQVCETSSEGQIQEQNRIPTTETSLRRHFGQREPVQVILEAGGSTPWVRRLLEELGHEVMVVNPRRIRLIAESTLKNDRIDAEILARLGRLGPELLQPVYQRSEAAQLLRTQIRVRSSLVHCRTQLINSVRGTLRSLGHRLRSCPTNRFVAAFCELSLPSELHQALDPLIETIHELSERIEHLGKTLGELAKLDELPLRLQTVPGVGPLVSLSFIAWMDRPERFARSRDVGAGLGLRPQLRESGGQSHRGRISREGDSEMRRLLVQAAHIALRSQKDSRLKRWGLSVVERRGKKKAVVAVARKIGVLLHRLWVTGESFQSLQPTT